MSDSTHHSSQVLIVGAGPTGLTAAAILGKLGIRVRIIDKNNARSDKSKALGVQAGRQTELISLNEKNQKVESTIRFADGRTEVITSDFVIGADGAHSVVRDAVKILFEGNHYAGDFILGDVKIKWPWPDAGVRLFISNKGAIASFPMKGDQRYRIILIPKIKITPSSSSEISQAEFQKILSTLSDGKIEIIESTWMTRFRVHHRLATSFQRGRVFLAGDAAHIHSPAGGQGMNTGIQDALNLGFKIARVLHGKSDLNELAQYEKERMPVAKNVLRGTDFVFKFALRLDNKWVGLARKFVLPKLVGNDWIRHRVVTAISEVKVAREEMKGYFV